MKTLIASIAERIIQGGHITEAEALELTQVKDSSLFFLFAEANRVPGALPGQRNFPLLHHQRQVRALP